MLSQVLQFVLQGWPSEVEEEALKPYFIREKNSVYTLAASYGGFGS